MYRRQTVQRDSMFAGDRQLVITVVQVLQFLEQTIERDPHYGPALRRAVMSQALVPEAARLGGAAVRAASSLLFFARRTVRFSLLD